MNQKACYLFSNNSKIEKEIGSKFMLVHFVINYVKNTSFLKYNVIFYDVFKTF